MYYLLYQNSQILLQKEGASYQLPESDTPLLPIQHSFSLTAPSGELCVAANVLTPQLPQQSPCEWIGIRQAYDLLPASIYQVVVKGAELTYWEATTKYCGSCGSLLEQHTDISKRCPKCQREFWPALAPAVIVAITRNEGKEITTDLWQASLKQAKRWRKRYNGKSWRKRAVASRIFAISAASHGHTLATLWSVSRQNGMGESCNCKRASSERAAGSRVRPFPICRARSVWPENSSTLG